MYQFLHEASIIYDQIDLDTVLEKINEVNKGKSAVKPREITKLKMFLDIFPVTQR